MLLKIVLGCFMCKFIHCDCGSHCKSLTMEGSLFAPSMNSSKLNFPSLFLSIWRKILSVRFSGVLSSSGIFITDPTILQIAYNDNKYGKLFSPRVTHLQYNYKKFTVTISSISCLEMYPFPSKSYIEKAHFNFCSNFPLDVTLNAHRNSRKSIVPSPLASNVRKTCSANYVDERRQNGKRNMYNLSITKCICKVRD